MRTGHSTSIHPAKTPQFFGQKMPKSSTRKHLTRPTLQRGISAIKRRALQRKLIERADAKHLAHITALALSADVNSKPTKYK
jgi:hypothetical protein